MGLQGLIAGQTRVQFIQNSTNTLIQLDASLKEAHKRESQPTEFPIEDGNNISDQIILRPFTLDITGIITDTPIGGAKQLVTEVATTFISALTPPVGLIAASAGYALFTSSKNAKSPSVQAYNQLLQLQENGQPFDVLTSLYRYHNMWIKSISAPRDSDTGRCLIFDISLKQLILVSPRSVNIGVFANPALSANQANLGQQNTGIPNGFKQGYANGTAATESVIGPQPLAGAHP